jgi:predicted transcriptional regulator
MLRHPHSELSRRERQIMDIVYRLGRATANEVIAQLADERHSSTVRTQLRLLEEKGRLRHEKEGARYVYSPVVPRGSVRRSALRHVIDTFFEGSAEKVVATLLARDARSLSREELDRLTDLIEKAKREERRGIDDPRRSGGRGPARREPS